MKNEVQWTFKNDPFTDIKPALLNSADIQAYQEVCGLIEGEEFSFKRLKSASYEITFKGDGYWWDLKGPQQRQRIEGDKPFLIKKNSIAYISPDVKFTLPDFMAMRFNLRINLVHRGLLLGTGPLVDPGFEGRLLIPLHNLTSQDIDVYAKDGLIWVEFTKISLLTDPSANTTTRAGKKYVFKPFPPEKKNLTSTDYFTAAGRGPFKSSLAELLESATEVLKTIRQWSFFGAIAGAVGIAALVISALQFGMQSTSTIRDANQWVQDSRQELAKKYVESKEATDELRARLDALESKIASKSNSSGSGSRTAKPTSKNSDAGTNRSTPIPTKSPK